MTSHTARVGQHGERLAAAYLTRAGMVIVDRNWRCRDGELDLVARDGPAVVFVEVKTRRGVGFGTPAAAVDAPKAARLRRLATRYLRHAGLRPPVVRFDVVAILLDRRGQAQVDHRAGAF
ncbi:MAG TPA: YraN family protein [Pilimelia sp.]|nr:YraN family protein [Pilimelia sp.]